MKKEQYEFCLNFYKICKQYLQEDIDIKKDNYETDQVKIKLFKKLKKELEELLSKGDLIRQNDVIILDDFYDAYDLAQMLHTYIDCIPEHKVYLLRELFTFLKKYKNKIDDNEYLNLWQTKIMLEEKKENLNKVIVNTRLKRKIIITLILTGTITTGAFFSQTKTCQKIINNINEFFNDDEQLSLERKK